MTTEAFESEDHKAESWQGFAVGFVTLIEAELHWVSQTGEMTDLHRRMQALLHPCEASSTEQESRPQLLLLEDIGVPAREIIAELKPQISASEQVS